MISVEPIANEVEIVRNEFAHLQLEIARLADELVRSVPSLLGRDQEAWLQAEREVVARHHASIGGRAGIPTAS
jgi:hypothetical protein